MQLEVLAVAERPPLIRVPAGLSNRHLPPQRWEQAYLAVNRVLLLFRLKCGPMGAQRLTSRWIRGDLPKLPSSELELLRVEMPVPPATKSVTAGKVVLAGLRKVALPWGCLYQQPNTSDSCRPCKSWLWEFSVCPGIRPDLAPGQWMLRDIPASLLDREYWGSGFSQQLPPPMGSWTAFRGTSCDSR